jgi:hypothetical protein
MDIQISVQETAEKTTTQTIVVAPGVEVCRVTVIRKTDGKRTRQVTEHVRYAGPPSDLTHGPEAHLNFGQFAVVEPELIERIRMTGWLNHEDDYKLICQKPFTRITKVEKPYAVVRLKSYDHSLYDLEGERLPVGMRFAEIDGRANDAHFDLPKLLAHLKTREDVTLHADPRHFGNGDPLVFRVPHYNQGDSCGYHHLVFTWHPDVATYREFVKRTEHQDHFYRFDVAHTMMGNDEFRIVESEEDHSEEDRSEDDEE